MSQQLNLGCGVVVGPGASQTAIVRVSVTDIGGIRSPLDSRSLIVNLEPCIAKDRAWVSRFKCCSRFLISYTS
jgi:hypothetical protein